MGLIEEIKKLAEHKCISPRDGYVLGIDYYIEQHQFDNLLKLISTHEANRAETLVSHVCGGLWYVMRNKHNNIIGYGAQDLGTVEEWCEQKLHPGLKRDVDYEIIIVGAEQCSCGDKSTGWTEINVVTFADYQQKNFGNMVQLTAANLANGWKLKRNGVAFKPPSITIRKINIEDVMKEKILKDALQEIIEECPKPKLPYGKRVVNIAKTALDECGRLETLVIRNATETKRKHLHELGRLIRAYGKKEPKKHGNYWRLNIGEQFYYWHDDYNNSVSLIDRTNDNQIKYYGIDWGGFETKLGLEDFENAVNSLKYFENVSGVSV